MKSINIYKHFFTSKCPVNQDIIDYRLTIKSSEMIEVESIVSITDSFEEGYHEDFADQLIERLGGTQTLKAYHHGVFIKTVRGEEQ
jgi:NADPH-dependent 7-cyano-7-deazaguanine reductase QueF